MTNQKRLTIKKIKFAVPHGALSGIMDPGDVSVVAREGVKPEGSHQTLYVKQRQNCVVVLHET